MRTGEVFARVAAWCAAHARIVLPVAALVALAAAVAATTLETDAGTDTLVDEDSESFQASEDMREQFGEDPVVVVAEGDLARLILTRNLGQLLRLEGCLAGRPPEGVDPLPGPCAELAELQPAKLVSGPATFLNQAVIGIDEQFRGQIREAQRQMAVAARAAAVDARRQGLSRAQQEAAARAAAQAVYQQFQELALELATQYGITRLPRIDDPTFVSAVVFDNRQPGNVPKAKLSYLFPNEDAAQIVIRLRPDLSDAERERALELIRAAVTDETPRQACALRGKPRPCFTLDAGRYVISGAPVVVAGLASELEDALLVLLFAAIALMALTLLAVFRSRLRLLPLALALAAAALTFGLAGLLGGSLTMASIAVLPVLIGLAVDYAIQLQARFDEAVAAGAEGAEAARRAAVRGGPVVGTACLATAAGFLALQLSPTPMVRTFGLLLVAGVVLAFGLTLTAGMAALALRRRPPVAGRRSPGAGRQAPVATPSRLGGIRERLAHVARSALAVSIASPGRVLAVALALALCGWVAGTKTDTVSDIRELVPGDLREVRDLEEVQDMTGVSGELDVTVRSDDLTDPELVAWMAAFKERVLEAGGFSGDVPTCRDAEICPGPALSDFIPDAARGGLTRARIVSLLDALPAYDLQGVIERDPETGELGDTANIAFGIRVMPLDEQQKLIDRIRAQVDPPGDAPGPPEGTTVRLAGLPVLAAESATDLERSRYWLTLAGLVAVALALLAVYRRPGRALVPLIPIALATGWSPLVIAAMDIPLNPMSAALGALVIAIATEFSVILAARYHEERQAGQSVGEALRRSYARTGAAVAASGLTAIAGFAALTASDIRMLRDFGLVTVVDLGVALIGVMLVLPAALVWAERGFELGGALPRRPRGLRHERAG
ncbi:MAG TPA: MMPL family transporter [Solirubrobacterales bacterium]|nr:MMPL family transporter [Solirubrobacterales bacterium]